MKPKFSKNHIFNHIFNQNTFLIFRKVKLIEYLILKPQIFRFGWKLCDTPTLWLCENYVIFILSAFLTKIRFTKHSKCRFFGQFQSFGKNKSGSVLAIWFSLKYVILTFFSLIVEEFDFPKVRKWISAKNWHFYQILASMTKECHEYFCSLHISGIRLCSRKMCVNLYHWRPLHFLPILGP